MSEVNDIRSVNHPHSNGRLLLTGRQVLGRSNACLKNDMPPRDKSNIYHFTYPERKLTMEEMLCKFIDEGKREHEEIRAFICDFQTTNEILFKERNNSLIELRFRVQELLKMINNTPMIDCEVKGVTTRGEKTTTQDAQNDDTNVYTEEPQAVNQDEPVESNDVLTNDQPHKTIKPVTQPSNKIQMPPIPFPRRLRKENEDLGASISLMSYTMYEKLGLGEPKATRMSLELADRSIQYPRGIIKNVLIKVDKFVLQIDFVILDKPEDSRVPIILERPFLATARAMIDVFNKKITLRVGDDEVIFDVDQSIKRPPTEDDECYGVDDLDDTINAEVWDLLANEEPESFLSRGLEKSIDHSDLEGCKPIECKTDYDSDSDKPIRRIASINTPYLIVQETAKPVEVEREHLYSASANEIDEKKPELKDLPHHLEYAYLHGFFQFPIALEDQEKITFTCPYGTFSYRRIPFGLCNAPATFQRCMTAIFHDMVEDFMEIFLDCRVTFGFGSTGGLDLACPIIRLSSQYGIQRVLGRITNSLPSVGTNWSPYLSLSILKKHRMLARCEETNLVLNWEKCHFMVKEGIVLGYKISEAGIEVDRAKIDVIAQLPYPTNVKGVRSFLGIDGKFKPIYYTSKTLNNAQEHYTTTEKELLAVVFSFDKFRPYLFLSKTIVLLLQGFDIEIKDKMGVENLAADHLSRLENPDLGTFMEEEIADEFLEEHLMLLKTDLNNDEPCASVTGRKVYESGFFWPSIFKDAKDYVMRCDACQRLGNMSLRNEMPQNNIQIYKERTKKWHDSRLWGDKNFKVRDMVLLFNSRFRMHPDKNGVSFKVNGQRSKKYHERHIDVKDK
ncbi:reverse transcriptase domain-containing protein [Tanacetum coccineum]